MKNPVLDLILEASDALKPRIWTINLRGEIRDAQGFCPICALADLNGFNRYRAAWKMALIQGLGLTSAEASMFGNDIAEAADAQYMWMDGHREMRDLLILALGVRNASA